MAVTTKKGKTGAQGAASTTSTDPQSVFQNLMAYTPKTSPAEISGTFRNSVLLPRDEATLDKFQAINTGIGNTSVRYGDIFKIVGVDMIRQQVQGEPRDLPILHIQNMEGEERSVYASGLLRSTPTANGVNNNYDDVKSEDGTKLLDFDRGILQGAASSFPKSIEKLVGDGSKWIKVDDVVRYETNGVRVAPREDGSPDTFVANNSAFRLVHLTEEEAQAENEA